ncbi:MAG TPA: iron uptake transporter deferrochelatase/peroxidase subunit [Roseiarcus sp.]|nr:iron uptake transporter deferrochelatase/peroxidase subunit [Roseiarcus sp.]
MTDGGHDRSRRATRRGFLAATAGLAAATGAGLARPARAIEAAPSAAIEPFYGAHQGGILTPSQAHTLFAAFDLTTAKRADLIELLRRWTDAAALMAAGKPVEIAREGDYAEAPDPADVLGLSAARLTVTFGFGASLFVKDGHGRYGLQARRPEAFVDLPHFPGDQLTPARTGGDLSVQACADNPQVAFHAIRQLSRLAYRVADIRWVQAGFVSDYGAGKTPRNLMGFKDGTGNPPTDNAREMDQVVWVGEEGPSWMHGGSYLVIRRARMALEHWDRMKVSFQEQTFGRKKLSGAPLGAESEFDPIDLAATDANGDLIIPENSHVRLAHQAALEGSRILRRAYSYNDGANVIAERWPPWRQGMEFDAGLIFICYQRDPRTAFIKIFDKMSRLDMMNQFVTNTGGGHFACPGGAAEGEYIGQRLFEAGS